jgi:SAM-dependent methyltransferase
MSVIETYVPDWRSRSIHESSPSNRGASARLIRECPGYSSSQFFQGNPLGSDVGGIRCESLEALTFADSSFDLFVTQDVLEHVFNPSKVFREIARVLKPGGMHVFTVPLVNKHKPSTLRAKIVNDEIVHLAPEQFHGNPIGDGKALVTVDWGFDICRHVFEGSRLFTTLIQIDDLSKGIRAEYIDVLVTRKALLDDSADLLP